MSHIVVYQTDDGSSGFEQCASLDDAIVIAERMRNVDGVETPRIFRMEEIEIDFRPYYRVQVAEGDLATAELDDLPAPPSAEDVAAAEAETGAPVTADAATWAPDSAEVDSDDDDGADEPDHVEDHVGDHDADSDHAHDDAGSDDDDHGDHDHGDDAGDHHDDGGEMHDAPSPEAAPEDTSDDDAMLSVRRGLFGR